MEKIDWGCLPFGYLKTDFNIRCVYKNGKWGNLEVSTSEYIDIHIAATGLHTALIVGCTAAQCLTPAGLHFQ